MFKAAKTGLSIAGQGNGGLDEVLAILGDNDVMFGGFRVTALDKKGGVTRCVALWLSACACQAWWHPRVRSYGCVFRSQHSYEARRLRMAGIEVQYEEETASAQPPQRGDEVLPWGSLDTEPAGRRDHVGGKPDAPAARHLRRSPAGEFRVRLLRASQRCQEEEAQGQEVRQQVC